MQSKALTVEQYLSELPEDRRAALQAVRQVILKNLDKNYEEGMQYGMIGYYVPHRIYPAGYHCDPKQPLPFVCLASQKNYMSLYMMTVYGEGAEETRFRDEWARTGKKLDMGKSCIRFKRLEDLALDVIGDTIRRVPVRKWIDYYESVVRNSRKSSGKSSRNTKKTSTLASATTSKRPKKAAAKPVAKKTPKRSVKKVARTLTNKTKK